MSTVAQINANQLNAQLSTGPRTVDGKSVVSKNATKHGLTASYPVIITPEEQTQFNALESAYQYEFHPRTPSDQTLFKQLVLAAWNIDRCHRLEAELATATGIDPLIDENQSKPLARIEAYRLRAERLFHRNLKLLKTCAPNTQSAAQNKPKLEPDTYTSSLAQSLNIGRNSPCPCLSGKKYKQCCIIKGEAYLRNTHFL